MRGFTLFEILVVIAIAAIIMGLAASQVNRIFELNMKRASQRLASTIRYLYNKSAMEGAYIRLVLDLDEQSYWVEATADPVVIPRGEGGEASDSRSKAKSGKEVDGEAGAHVEGEGGKPGKIKPPEVTFGQVDSHLLHPTKLPDSVFFKDIYVEHRPLPIEGGKEAIFFFPNGYVERAIINLRDEDDETNYSLKTNPVSGRVNIENRYRSNLENDK